jgi:REP element-mobilizing transposase RayT
MDNHFHLIARTGKEPKSLSKYMQKISVTFAMEINRKYQRVGHIFQGRYNAKYLEYKKDLIQVTRYVQQNPIREGLVKKASDYPWLSRN